MRCWNSSCHGGGTCGPALVDCGCGIGYEAGFGAGFGAGCGSRNRSAVVARQLQRRGRAGSGTATSAAREGVATSATLAAVRRARRSLGRGPTRAEAPADDEKARGRGPRGRVGCCRARDRGLRARTAGAAWGGALRTSHSHRGTIRAHSGHYRIAARRGQHTVRGRRTSYIFSNKRNILCPALLSAAWSGRLGPMYAGRFRTVGTKYHGTCGLRAMAPMAADGVQWLALLRTFNLNFLTHLQSSFGYTSSNNCTIRGNPWLVRPAP